MGPSTGALQDLSWPSGGVLGTTLPTTPSSVELALTREVSWLHVWSCAASRPKLTLASVQRGLAELCVG